MLLNGCSTFKGLPDATLAQDTQPLLHFQKTPCLGTCPAYNAMIYENGSISYVEFKNALAQNTISLQLTEEELQQLKRKIEELNYKGLQRRYLTQWSDMPSTYLTFFEQGKEVKRVKHEEGGPQRLIQFQDWLHNLIWPRAEEKKIPKY